jgi:hypothetical protein
LVLKTLWAKLASVRAARSARGNYLILTLNITNKTTAPKSFGHAGTQPTVFVAGGKYREEILNAERNDPNSFVRKNAAIRPGASQTGDVIFEVPTSVARNVMNEFDGGLFTGDFGSNFAISLPASGHLGLISLQTRLEPGAREP